MIIEGDVFRIIVPLDTEYSHDALNKKDNGLNGSNKTDQLDQSNQNNKNEDKLEEKLIQMKMERCLIQKQ
ncbi:MAG: hypothetical protein R3Y24_07575 [Eubacteriales bacterium]